MGDSYRPPAYAWPRRGSSPGRPGGRDYMPPDRPAPPPRSFSSMDGRHNPNPTPGTPDQRNKRNASRSPEGAQARKQQRQDTQQNGVTPDNLNGSRRSSIANVVTPSAQPTHMGAQSPGSQQLSVPMDVVRKPSDSVITRSPRSPHESVTSGRSTPQQRPSALSRETTAQLPNGASVSGSESTGELTDLLHKFSSEVASRAALEHEKNQAEARFRSTQREYNEMEKHFKVYPAIKERKSTDKDIAREDLQAKKKSLNEHMSSQKTIIEALASQLGQIATVKPGGDVVSRAEYESLQNDLLELKEEILVTRQLRSDLDSTKVKTEEAMTRTAKLPVLQEKVDLVHRANVAATAWKQTVDTRLRDVANFDQRLKSNETRFATQKALDDFKNHAAGQFATKQSIDDLESKLEPFSQKIETLQTGQVKATADSLKTLNFIKDQATVKQDIVNLQTLGSNLKARADEATAKREGITQTISQLRADVVDCKEQVDVVRDSIEEEGKEVIVKRVKRLDVLVNNLSSKIGDDSNASTHKRLSVLESDFKAIQQGLRSMKNGQPQPTDNASANGTTMDLNLLETRLSRIEKEFNTLYQQQEEKDNELIAHVDGVEKSLKEQFSQEITDRLATRDGVQKAILNSIDKITNGCRDLQKSVDGFEEALRSKADSTTVDALKGDVSSVSEEVRKWQAQHQRTKSIPQTATPANQGPQPNGPQQASPQLQQLPNGITRSPQVNGTQPPQSPYNVQHNHGHGSPQHAPVSAQNQQLVEMQQQMNGLVVATQQLKQRYDNLQTDEVVRSMIDQFRTIYPDAHNINAAVQGLQRSLNGVQQQLANLQQQKAPASEQFGEDIKRLSAKAEGVSNTAHNAFQQVQNAWAEINKIRDSVTTLENEVAKKSTAAQRAPSNDSSMRDAVNAIRQDLDKTNVLATAADRLSRGNASRFSKTMPETLLDRMSVVESKVGDHDRKLSEGESAVKKLQSEATSAKKAIDKMGGNYGALKYKVERLEEEEEEEADD